MIYKKRYGQPFDTESVVGSFLPMMETIPYLTKEMSCMVLAKTSVASTSAGGCTKANAPMTATIPRANPRCTVLIIL